MSFTSTGKKPTVAASKKGDGVFPTAKTGSTVRGQTTAPRTSRGDGSALAVLDDHDQPALSESGGHKSGLGKKKFSASAMAQAARKMKPSTYP